MIQFRVDFAKAIGESTAMLSPIAACYSMLDDETYAIMKQKFDICYSMAKESIPFVKYPACSIRYVAGCNKEVYDTSMVHTLSSIRTRL